MLGFISFALLVIWLVVLALMALETVFQSISGRLSGSGRKKIEMIDERKCPNSPHPLQAQRALALL